MKELTITKEYKVAFVEALKEYVELSGLSKDEIINNSDYNADYDEYYDCADYKSLKIEFDEGEISKKIYFYDENGNIIGQEVLDEIAVKLTRVDKRYIYFTSDYFNFKCKIAEVMNSIEYIDVQEITSLACMLDFIDLDESEII